MEWLPNGLGKYVYFASLEIGSQPERELANFIKRELVFKNDLSSPDTDFYEKINNALELLETIANNEKAKEQQAIFTYERKIEQIIQDPEMPENIKQYFNQQKTLLNQVYNGIPRSGMSASEINLIKNLNLVEQDLKLFQRRLNEIERAKENPASVWSVLEYRQEEQLDQFITFLTTNTASRGKKEKNKLIAKTLKQIINKTLNNLSIDIPGVKELLTGLLYVDFMDEIQNNLNLDIYQLEISDLRKYLKDYFNKNTNDKNKAERTNLINLLINNQEESVHLIQDFSNFLGVEFINQKQYESLKKNLEQIKELKKEGKTQTEIIKIIGRSEDQIRKRIKMYENNISQTNDALTIRTKNATSHGFLNEIRRVIMKNGIDVEKNVGIDTIIPLCTFSLGTNDNYIQQELLSASRDINNILGDAFTDIQQNPITLTTLNEAIAKEKNMNELIETKIKKSREKINKLKNENTFLSFESLKLSRTHEMKQSLDEDYKGRTMNILSALTKLYAAPGFSSALMDINTLIIFLLNISKNTLGAQNKEPLETYLSLFAGLLMFDDISYMASEALKNIASEIPSSNSTEVLHVYGINNIYYPISIILEDLIKQVKHAMQFELSLSINSNKTAHAHIIQSSPSYKTGHNQEADWNAIAEKTIQSTKIQLGFLAGFTNYISDLNNAMKIQQ